MTPLAKFMLWLTVVSGVAAVAVSGYYLLIEWAELRRFMIPFELSLHSSDSLFALTRAYDHQEFYRIDCFADGVGVLLGAILAAIGIHGLALGSRPGEPAAKTEPGVKAIVN